MQLIACQKEDKVIWTQIFSGKQEYRYKYIFLKFLHDNNIYSMLFILLYRGRNPIQNKYMKKTRWKIKREKIKKKKELCKLQESTLWEHWRPGCCGQEQENHHHLGKVYCLVILFLYLAIKWNGFVYYLLLQAIVILGITILKQQIDVTDNSKTCKWHQIARSGSF